MALGVGPAWYREAYEIERRGHLGAVWLQAEHDRSDLARPDPPGLVQRNGERLTRIGERLDVGEQGTSVEVDRVPADGPHHGDARRDEGVAEVGRRLDAVAQVVVVDDLGQTLGDGFEVAAGESAVGGEALGEDQDLAAALGQLRVAHREPPADVGEAVLLGTHGHAVGERGDLAHDVGDLALGLARLTLADEPRVLREATGVEEERPVVLVADRAHSAQVLERDRLSSPGVVGDGHEDDRDVVTAIGEQRVEATQVHVPLEGVEVRRVQALGDDQVERLSPGRLDVGPRRVEVGVVRDDLAGAADDAEQDLLRGPALVRRDHVGEGEEPLDTLEESEPRR